MKQKTVHRSSTPSADALLKNDSLADFSVRHLTFEENTKAVLSSGVGPAVVVMSEMPGISPHVARFARWIRESGFTVYLPSLFGRDGAVPDAETGAAIFRKACVSAEFHALGSRGASPVTSWLRALARFARLECGGAGVGAIGMCFTGNFALSMMLEPSVIAPVLAQPSLPLDAPAAVESDADELKAIRERMERGNLTALAFRFAGDRFCRAERFDTYRKALGDRFVARVLPDSAADLSALPPFFAAHVNFPHSVLTVNLIDRQGQATLAARDEIIAFLNQRLKPSR